MKIPNIKLLMSVTDEEFQACREQVQQADLTDKQKQVLINVLATTPQRLNLLKQLGLQDEL